MNERSMLTLSINRGHMSWIRFRRRALSALALMMVTGAPSLVAQGVTLPSARVVGPSPAVQQLLQLFDESETWIPSSDTAEHEAFEFVRYRLLLSPFRCKELAKIEPDPTFQRIWTTLYDDVLHDANRGLVVAVWTRLRQSHRPDTAEKRLIRFAITGVDSGTTSSGSAMRLLPKTVTTARPPASDSGGCNVIDRMSGALRIRSEVTERETGALPTLMAEGRSEALRARLDSLGRVARLVVIERKLRRGLVPVHSSEQARVFWRQRGLSPLNMGALTGNGSAGAAFTELAAPLLHAVRLSLNTVLSSSNKTAEKSTASASRTGAAAAETETTGDETELTRFLNGGGQLNIGASLPLLFTGRRDGAISLMVLAAPRVGATVGALGAFNQDKSAFVDPAVEIHIGSTDAVEHVGFFTQTRSGYASGGSKFGEALGVGAKSGFAYTNFAAGLIFGDRYLLTGGRTISGPAAMRNLGWQVGVTVIRGAQ